MPMRFASTSARFSRIIDAGAAGFLVIVAQRHAAEADRLAGAGPVHHQHRNAAPDQVGHAAQELDFLGDVEAVEEHHAGRARGFRVLRVHEIAGQLLALERHLDDLDLGVGQRGELVEAVDRRCDRRRARARPSACGSARPSGNNGRRAGRTTRPRPDGARRGNARHGRAPRRRP